MEFSPTPPTNIAAQVIDFSKTPLPSYHSPEPHFALIIDNFLSPSECASLISHAKSSVSGWEPALVNTGFTTQRHMPNIRKCGRIMIDDHEIVGKLFDRLLPYLPDDIKEIRADGPWFGSMAGSRWKWREGDGEPDKWRAVRLNERLRFLRYEKGNYFREHCDGSYVDPNTGQQSFLTFHLYLSDETAVKGGATRFFAYKKHWDVEPKMGRVLVFQHGGLVHSGVEVDHGEKVTVRTDIMYEKLE